MTNLRLGAAAGTDFQRDAEDANGGLAALEENEAAEEAEAEVEAGDGEGEGEENGAGRWCSLSMSMSFPCGSSAPPSLRGSHVADEGEDGSTARQDVSNMRTHTRTARSTGTQHMAALRANTEQHT